MKYKSDGSLIYQIESHFKKDHEPKCYDYYAIYKLVIESIDFYSTVRALQIIVVNVVMSNRPVY